MRAACSSSTGIDWKEARRIPLGRPEGGGGREQLVADLERGDEHPVEGEGAEEEEADAERPLRGRRHGPAGPATTARAKLSHRSRPPRAGRPRSRSSPP